MILDFFFICIINISYNLIPLMWERNGPTWVYHFIARIFHSIVHASDFIKTCSWKIGSIIVILYSLHNVDQHNNGIAIEGTSPLWKRGGEKKSRESRSYKIIEEWNRLSSKQLKRTSIDSLTCYIANPNLKSSNGRLPCLAIYACIIANLN